MVFHLFFTKEKGNVDMPYGAPVLDSVPQIYVPAKSQDDETARKMKRV